jgi:hypothetical protein
MVLLIVVLLTGTEVRLNPSEITALVQARDADDPSKKYTPEVRCVVQMANNAQYATTEECNSIENRINTLKASPQ